MGQNKMTKIFIVMGATGKYDYYQEWLVRAFLDHDKAIDYAMLCKGEADTGERSNKYDGNMPQTYYDIDYFISEVELDE
jgi:hypothetical protein